MGKINWAKVFPGLKLKEKEDPKEKKFKKEKNSSEKVESKVKTQEMMAKMSLVPVLYFIRLNKIIFIINSTFIVFVLVLIIENVSMYPLVEKRYSFLELIGKEDNYVKMTYTNEKENEGLIKGLIVRYIIKREQISYNDDVEYVLAYSDKSVQQDYLKIQKKLKETNIRRHFKRNIRIDRYQKIENNIRQIEIVTRDFIKNPNNKKDKTPSIEEKRWIINIKFEFKNQTMKLSDLGKNGSGFFVVKYNLKGIL